MDIDWAVGVGEDSGVDVGEGCGVDVGEGCGVDVGEGCGVDVAVGTGAGVGVATTSRSTTMTCGSPQAVSSIAIAASAAVRNIRSFTNV